MRSSDIAGLSSQQIASKFSLKNVPDMIVDVVVPSGTKMYTGKAGKLFGGDGGGQQFFVANTRLDANYFTNARPLR